MSTEPFLTRPATPTQHRLRRAMIRRYLSDITKGDPARRTMMLEAFGVGASEAPISDDEIVATYGIRGRTLVAEARVLLEHMTGMDSRFTSIISAMEGRACSEQVRAELADENVKRLNVARIELEGCRDKQARLYPQLEPAPVSLAGRLRARALWLAVIPLFAVVGVVEWLTVSPIVATMTLSAAVGVPLMTKALTSRSLPGAFDYLRDDLERKVETYAHLVEEHEAIDQMLLDPIVDGAGAEEPMRAILRAGVADTTAQGAVTDIHRLLRVITDGLEAIGARPYERKVSLPGELVARLRQDRPCGIGADLDAPSDRDRVEAGRCLGLEIESVPGSSMLEVSYLMPDSGDPLLLRAPIA